MLCRRSENRGQSKVQTSTRVCSRVPDDPVLAGEHVLPVGVREPGDHQRKNIALVSLGTAEFTSEAGEANVWFNISDFTFIFFQ